MHRQTRAKSISAKVKDTVAKETAPTDRQPVSSAVLLAVPTVMWCADLRAEWGSRRTSSPSVINVTMLLMKDCLWTGFARWDLTAGRTSVLISSTTSKDFTLTGARRR